jgi:Repeat of unknown function (DUF5648)
MSATDRPFWALMLMRTGLTAVLLSFAGLVGTSGEVGAASAEVKLDKDYLAGLVEKLPPLPFKNGDQSRGSAYGYRLVAIDPQARRFRVVSQVDGEFRPTIAGPWRKFRFEVRVGINIEPGRDGTPRFRIEVEEVRRKELEGLAGTLAKLLGKYFDDMVTRVAAGKAAQMSDKLNAEIVKRIGAFKEYGVFSGIDYTPTLVVLRFDMTRYKSEGVAGYLYPTTDPPPPGTVPLYRADHPQLGVHLYTTNPNEADSGGFRRDGIAGYVYDRPVPAAVPLYRWRVRRDDFYTIGRDGEGCYRLGYRYEGVACFLYAESKPGTVPFYRFIDPRSGRHFYTVHPHAEFAK